VGVRDHRLAVTGRRGGDPCRRRTYRPSVKLKLLIGVVLPLSIAAATTGTAPAQTAGACVVPKLFTLTQAVAGSRLAAAGCRVGPVTFERPRGHRPRVVGQVPAPGAVLPRGTRVSLLVA
jgi:beta-lactam-binding protein with PASTA domain